MLVIDVMTTKIKTVRPESTMRDAATLLGFYHISGLPVVSESGAVVGVISEKDVLRAMYPKIDRASQLSDLVRFGDFDSEFHNVMDARVSEFMTKNVSVVGPDDHILQAAAIMIARKIRRIPVVENKSLVGILSIGDVHKAVLKETFDRKLVNNDQSTFLKPRT